jgi:hypothetical protein
LRSDAIIHLLEQLKSKTLTTPKADEDVEQQKPSLIVEGIQSVVTCLENSL